MSTDTNKPGAAFGQPLRRRQLLRESVAVGGLALFAALAKPLSVSAADDAVQAFTQLSEFLTGYTLDPVLGGRYFAALSKRSPTFETDMLALQQAVRQSGAASMDTFLALPGLNKSLTKSATTIVAAWYLGVVGNPEDAELITYAEALMYRPTRGILPIPTYGPGPNAWGPKPDTKI